MPACSQWSFYIRFPHQNPVCTSSLPHTCHMPCPSHSSWFDHPSNIGWGAQIMKHLAMQSPPVPFCLAPFRPKFLGTNFKLRFTSFDFPSKWFMELWNSGLEAPSDTSCHGWNVICFVPEFQKIAVATAIGFSIMGFIGFFVKLIHIPINNIIVWVAVPMLLHLCDVPLYFVVWLTLLCHFLQGFVDGRLFHRITRAHLHHNLVHTVTDRNKLFFLSVEYWKRIAINSQYNERQWTVQSYLLRWSFIVMKGNKKKFVT